MQTNFNRALHTLFVPPVIHLQQRVVEWVDEKEPKMEDRVYDYIKAHGEPLKVREIAGAMGLMPNSVTRMCANLFKAGRLGRSKVVIVRGVLGYVYSATGNPKKDA